MGPQKIKYELEKRGIPTSTGLKTWSFGTISRMLQNPFYCGTVIYRKAYVPDYLEQKPKKNNGEVEQVIVEGKHQPIISKEDFEKVQKLIQSHSVFKKDSKKNESNNQNNNQIENTTNESNEVISSVKVTINNKEYILNLEDNETARSFVNILPQEFNMNELHGNEKYDIIIYERRLIKCQYMIIL